MAARGRLYLTSKTINVKHVYKTDVPGEVLLSHTNAKVVDQSRVSRKYRCIAWSENSLIKWIEGGKVHLHCRYTERPYRRFPEDSH